jgi:small subunit ribosomal protein S20
LANTKSAKKRARVSERRRIRNRRYRSASRTLVRSAVVDIRQQNADEAAESVKLAISMLDRAASKGVIHKNNAARRKSRLMAKYNQLVSQG